MNKLTTLVLGALLLPMTLVRAAESDLAELQVRAAGHDWLLIKSDTRHGIKTYAKQEEGKRVRSFKVDAVLEGSLENYIRMLLDAENFKRWYFQVSDSKLLKKVSPTEYMIYLVHKAPPGTPDRDAVLQIEFEPPTSERPYLLIKQRSLPGYIAEKPPYIRVKAEDIDIKAIVLADNKLRIEAEGFMDPGGNDPVWAYAPT
jgi:hypothetical protein